MFENQLFEFSLSGFTSTILLRLGEERMIPKIVIQKWVSEEGSSILSPMTIEMDSSDVNKLLLVLDETKRVLLLSDLLQKE